MRIYGFAFAGKNVSTNVIGRLRNIDRRDQVWPNSCEKYLDFLVHDNPEYILGLGVYSGRDQDKIRIERACTNKFRNNFVDGISLIRLDIDPYLEPLEVSRYAQGIGNSFCNLLSWKITRFIGSGRLTSRYTFLHLPKTMNVLQIVSEVDNMLSTFVLNQQYKGHPAKILFFKRMV